MTADFDTGYTPNAPAYGNWLDPAADPASDVQRAKQSMYAPWEEPDEPFTLDVSVAVLAALLDNKKLHKITAPAIPDDVHGASAILFAMEYVSRALGVDQLRLTLTGGDVVTYAPAT